MTGGFKAAGLTAILAVALAFLCFGLLSAYIWPPSSTVSVLVQSPAEPWERLAEFYAVQDGPSDKRDALLQEVAELAESALVLRCAEDQTDTFLALLTVESDVRPGLKGDDGHSLGVGQVHRAQTRRLLKRLQKAGIPAGDRGTLGREVTLSVEAWREALELSQGDVRQALARYNGGTRWRLKKPQGYADKVLKRRGRIFGRPAERGEQTHLFREC